MENLPDELQEKVWIIAGTPSEIVGHINRKGFQRLYIDGGQTIQSFLKSDLIDEMIISKIPVLLGGGVSLFSELSSTLSFELIKSEVFLNQIVQDTYWRKR